MRNLILLSAVSLILSFNVIGQSIYDIPSKESLLESTLIAEVKHISQSNLTDSNNNTFLTVKASVTSLFYGEAVDTVSIVYTGSMSNVHNPMYIPEGCTAILAFLPHRSVRGGYKPMLSQNLFGLNCSPNDNSRGYNGISNIPIDNWSDYRESLYESLDIVHETQIYEDSYLSSANLELCLSISDIIPIASTNEVEFIINAKSSIDNVGLSELVIEQSYPTGNFGEFVVTNNRLSVEDVTGSSSAVYSSTKSDKTNTKYELKLLSNCTEDNIGKLILSDEYKPVLRVRLKVQNWGDYGSIDLSDFVVSGTAKFSSGDNKCVDYSSVCNGGGSFTVMQCNITSVSMNSSSSGTLETITILGNNFGSVGIVGNIVAPNSEVGGNVNFSMGGSLNERIVEWTDESITLRPPSLGLDGSTGIVAGSGEWIVNPDITSTPEMLQCMTQIEVDFAIKNLREENTLEDRAASLSFNPGGIAPNPTGKFRFYLQGQISQNPNLIQNGITLQMVEDVIIAALCDWESATGVDFEYMGTSNNSILDQNDNINMVGFTSNVELGFTTAIFNEGFCGPENYFSGRIDDVRIEFNENLDYFVSTGTNGIDNTVHDFYSLLIHEIGHALQLDHSNDLIDNGSNDSRIMYFGLQRGQIKRNIDAESIRGVQYYTGLVTADITDTDGCLEGFKLDLVDDSCLTPTSDYKSPQACQVNVFATVNKKIIINPDDNTRLSSNSVKLYDLNGRLLDSKVINNAESIELNVPTSGVYIVTFQCDFGHDVRKVFVH